jgi:diguanylate cyclase (GGDEF)-like protein/PAS domain S-box-containing protein
MKLQAQGTMSHTPQCLDICNEHAVYLSTIATRDVITLQIDDTLGAAAAIMADRRISSILILNAAQQPAGIVTERNILHAMQSGKGLDTGIAEVMSAPIISVPQTMACQEAYLLCLREGIRHLALVNDEGTLTGIASDTDFRLHLNLTVLAGRRQVTSVMTRSVLSLPPEASLRQAIDLMEEHRDTCVVVVEQNRPLGIVTERDVVRLYVHPTGSAMPKLSEVMAAPVATVPIDTTVNEAANRMLDSRTRHLVVIDHAGDLAGLITEHDLTQTMALGLIDASMDAERTFLRALVDNIPDLVWMKDPNGVFLACNHRFEHLVAAQEADIVGKTDYDFVDRDLADFFRANDRKAIAKGGPIINEEWVRFANDGHRELLETIKTPMHDAEGRLIGVLGIGRDITAARQAQDALKDSKSKLRTLIDAIPDSVQFKDSEGRWLAYNRTAARTFGLGDVDCLGKSDLELAELADREQRSALLRCRQTDKDALQAGVIAHVEEEIPLASGGHRYFDVTKVPILQADGKPDGLVILARDVSDSRRITQALQQSLRDFNELVTRIPVGVFKFRTLADGNHRFDYVSPRWCEMVGLTADEAYQDADAAFSLAHPEDMEGFQTTIQAAKQSQTPFDWEGRLQNHRGTRWLHIGASPHLLDNGDIQWDGIQYDITDRRHMEEVIREKERKYKALFETANDGIFLLDPNGFIDCNQRGADMYGLSKAALIDRSPEQFWPRHQPDGRLSSDSYAEKIQDALAGEPQNFEWQSLRADGTPFDVEITLNRIELGDSICLQAIVRDIGKRKQVEEGRRLAASVFTSTHEGIIITDATARIVEVNEAFTRITGYHRDEVLGKNPSLLKSGHQDSGFYQAMWQTLVQTGHWSGEVWNRRKNGSVYAEHLTISAVRNGYGSVTHFVGILADITLLKEHERHLERIAHFDALTGVPNRLMLADRMAQAAAQTLRTGNLMAVCYLDLDGFKPVNDSFGHDAGDRVLIEMTLRMKEYLRGGDTIARVGGDEFVLLLLGLHRLEECEAALERILGAISRPVHIAGHRITLSASLGVTLFPEDDSDADTLLHHADLAMYQAKESGKNRFHMFDPVHERQIKAHRVNQQRLATALEQGEFELHYQPKVNMSTGEVVGAEALIRWRHPERGLLLPREFLSVVSGSSLEISLGEWTLVTALDQLTRWRDSGLRLAVSVNISADHLLRSNFPDRLQTILSQYPDATDSLELEIQESTAIANLEQASRTLAACRRLGVQFALDDFGTGYASLTHLRQLPVETLKIDQSFVNGMLDDPEDLGIVESIVQLTRSFNRSVIAEGVETQAHCALLMRLRCPVGQGFGIARPMPADQFADWTVRWLNQRKWQDFARMPLPKNRKDLVLKTAIESHRKWVDSIAAYLRKPIIFDAPSLHGHQCRFGLWYHGSGTIRYGHMPEFAALDESHEAIHALAAELAGLANNGRSTEAVSRLGELYVLRDSLVAQLELFIKTVSKT